MMATTAQIPLEQYLQTAYEPDCDYVEGELEERAVGEYDHATWQGILVMFFGARQREWGIKVRPELRVRVGPDRVRIPDVCLLSHSAPIERIITHPPLAVFEILSPEDRMTRVMDRLSDFDRMGIGAIWVVDPRKSSYYRYSSGQLSPASLFVLPGSDYRVEMSEIAALID